MTATARVAGARAEGDTLIFDLGYVGGPSYVALGALVAACIVLSVSVLMLLTPHRSWTFLAVALVLVAVAGVALARLRSRGHAIVVRLIRPSSEPSSSPAKPRYEVQHANETVAAGEVTFDSLEIRQMYLPGGRYQHVPSMVSNLNLTIGALPPGLAHREEEGLVLVSRDDPDDTLQALKDICAFLGLGQPAPIRRLE